MEKEFNSYIKLEKYECLDKKNYYWIEFFEKLQQPYIDSSVYLS